MDLRRYSNLLTGIFRWRVLPATGFWVTPIDDYADEVRSRLKRFPPHLCRSIDEVR